MKKTYALAFVFFISLAALWWLDYAQIPREEERLARQHRVLGGLFDAQAREIRRVEIGRGDQVTSFERRGVHRWQMIKPHEAEADPAVVENLIRNLIDLSRSPDIGTITDSGKTYGLDPPAAVIRIGGVRRAGPEIDATLEVGNTQRGVRFVRPHGEAGIEAIDAKLLSALDLPIADWREKALVPIPTFQIAGMSVRSAASSYEAARDRAGHWSLREPVITPANAIKIENILVTLTSLRVADDAAGFVANDVRDLSKFGLDRPELTLTLKTIGPSDRPIVLDLGKAAPGKPNRIFAKKGDQDDVLLVEDKILSEIPRNAKELRIGKVAAMDPGHVVKIGIDAPFIGERFTLDRTAAGWKQSEPAAGPVDAKSIMALIGSLDGLQSSELFDPSGPDDPRMSPPAMTIRLWQAGMSSAGAEGDLPIEPRPSLSLLIGHHDVLRKTVYGRLEGDSFILALPDSILKTLPTNSHAFRDRAVLALNPALIRNLTIKQHGRSYEIAPTTDAGPNAPWKLVAPVAGKVDMPVLSQIFASLSRLRAEEFVADARGGDHDRQFGLDHPTIEISWEMETKGRSASTTPPLVSGRLKVGGRAGRTSAFYAKLEHLPIIFTLDAAVVATFENEPHDRTIFNFAADRVGKVVMRWPNRSLTLLRKSGSMGIESTWTPEPTSEASGVDLAQITPMLSQISRLQAIKFLQYGGILPVMTGLGAPRLTIEFHLENDPTPRILRIGHVREEGVVYAAEGSGASGPVFFLPARAWDHLVEAGRQDIELPGDVFAPANQPGPAQP